MLWLMLPIFALVAYYDNKSRDIPEWLLAFSWFCYPLAIIIGGTANIQYLILPLSIGFFWMLYVSWKKLGVKELYGRADVFMLSLYLPIIYNTNLAYDLLLLLIFGFLCLIWHTFAGKKERRKGIPLLYIAFLMALIVILGNV